VESTLNAGGEDTKGENLEQAQLEAAWKVVRDDPSNFEAWVALVGTAEKLDKIEEIRKALSALLDEYPLCFGYWKRWAGHEQRVNQQDKCFQVLESGVKATPLSYRLWLHYCELIASKNDPEQTRSLFLRATRTAGRDLQASQLWQKYLEFELDQAKLLQTCRVVFFCLFWNFFFTSSTIRKVLAKIFNMG